MTRAIKRAFDDTEDSIEAFRRLDAEDHEDYADCQFTRSPSQFMTIIAKPKTDMANKDKLSRKWLRKIDAPFRAKDLSDLFKQPGPFQAQILSSTRLTILNDADHKIIIEPVSAGYVSHSFIVKIDHKNTNNDNTGNNIFFTKVNMNKDAKQMFDAEVHGLRLLHEACMFLMRVPQPIATGDLSELGYHRQGAWFLSEYVAMMSTKKKKTNDQYRRFAQALAKMHQFSAKKYASSSRSGQFGFDINNFYIHTEQENAWNSDWCTFYLEQRLKPVVLRMKNDPDLIDDHKKNMELILLCDRLILHVPSFLNANRVHIRPSLLHGDLNDKNWSLDEKDQIVIYDGSPFFGSYEADIYTMPDVFIQAYFEAIGGPTHGYEMRFELYNLVQHLRCIVDVGHNFWRPKAFECLNKLLTDCGAWTLPLVKFPCGQKTPFDKINRPSFPSTKTKNVILVYGGSFCPIHLNHIAVMDLVAETLEKLPYNFEILGGYFCPSRESWIKKKLSGKYLPNTYREALLLLATEGTRWMIDRSYSAPNTFSNNIIHTIKDQYDGRYEITVVHICGIDAIEASQKRVSTRYPLVVVDRSGYDGETLWKCRLEKTTAAHRERLIWITPWTGRTRSSTMIRDLLVNATDDHVGVRQSLVDFLPSACIEYISEYNLGKWFK